MVGSRLCEALRQAGLTTTGLTRSDAGMKPVFGDGPHHWSAAGYSDIRKLTEALEGVDVLFHVAGLTRGRTVEDYRRGNVVPTVALLEACVIAGVRRFVLVSSLAAGGPVPRERVPDPIPSSNRCWVELGACVTELDPPRPGDGYGQSKLEAERIVLERAGEIEVVIVRPPAVYGPGDHNFFDLFRLADQRGLSIAMGSGRQRVSLVEAGDLADGLVLAGTKEGISGRTFYFSGGDHAMGEVIDAMEAAAGRRLRRIRVPAIAARAAAEVGQLWWAVTGRAPALSRRKVRDLLQPAWVCSDQRAREQLGYQPKIELTAGFAQTMAWYRSRKWTYPKS